MSNLSQCMRLGPRSNDSPTEKEIATLRIIAEHQGETLAKMAELAGLKPATLAGRVNALRIKGLLTGTCVNESGRRWL